MLPSASLGNMEFRMEQMFFINRYLHMAVMLTVPYFVVQVVTKGVTVVS